jgi:GNAT superfamily N-acetyltransferase
VPGTLDGMTAQTRTTTPLRDAALEWVVRPRQVVLRPGPTMSGRPWARAEPTTLQVRGARPDDGPALAAMHARCTMDTIFRRYLCAVPALSALWQAQLLATTVALVAVDAHGAVRALGNVGGLDQVGTAELAVLVEDTYQGRGLGTALARHLAAAARLAGFRTLRMDLLPSSTAAARTAAHLGPAVAVVGQGVVTLTMPLSVTALNGLGAA